MSSRLVVLLIFLAMGSLSGCSTAAKLKQKIFPSSKSASQAGTSSNPICGHANPSNHHMGIAIKTNASETNLLSASGNFPDIKIGSTEFLITQGNIAGAAKSGPIPYVNTSSDGFVTAQGQWVGERILMFAGPRTQKKNLTSQNTLGFQGQAYLEYKPANEPTIELSASTQLTIDADTGLARLSIIDLTSSRVPFEKLLWTQIAYCEGQFQSTGSGRYRLIAASGRITNLIGLSAQGPAGTAILSGSLYGEQQPNLAALAFSLSGVTGTLIGVATMSASFP